MEQVVMLELGMVEEVVKEFDPAAEVITIHAVLVSVSVHTHTTTTTPTPTHTHTHTHRLDKLQWC